MNEGVAITGGGAVSARGVWPDVWRGAGSLASSILTDAGGGRGARAERVTQLALAAADAAVAEAGLGASGDALRPGLGIVLGTAFGCFLTNTGFQQRLVAGGPAAASPRLFAATVSNAAAGEVGIAHRLGGPTVTLTAGGVAGLLALGHGCDLLTSGSAQALLAGGVDAVGGALEAWVRAGGLSVGYPLVEAAAVLVLEPVAAAEAEGRAIHGRLLGQGAAFETAPDGPAAGAALGEAIRRAISEAAVAPEAVLLVMSGVAPKLALLEQRAVAQGLGGEQPRRLAWKETLGETLGAGGPLAVLAAMAELGPGETALVVDVCSSGHAGALVVRRE